MVSLGLFCKHSYLIIQAIVLGFFIGSSWREMSKGRIDLEIFMESSNLFEIIVIKVPQHADKIKVISPIFSLLSGTQLLSVQAKHHFKCTRLKYAQSFVIHQNQTDPDVLTGDFFSWAITNQGCSVLIFYTVQLHGQKWQKHLYLVQIPIT